MENLYQKSYLKLHRISTQFKRYLADFIDWNNRLIGIEGARGAGKTTMVLQYAKENLPLNNQTLYVSLDELLFTENKLVDFTEQFVMHKDSFSGSSLMHLNPAKDDLSRQTVMHKLSGLSFREYLNISHGT
ncbi:MAG: AAA family ATPase [Prolixibacteraceae bacterium]|nr:AAA family ATPase [Prolixibacteraceae bacterium]MBN2650228.1 AAA family ATPase [Prolixibacteraceae bacterium]